MYKLIFYVPESHLNAVKRALFSKGAGRIGQYDCCAWQTKGQGQFRPLPGSNPSIGDQNALEQVEEYKVEMVVADHLIDAVIAELKAEHPYEEPGYAFYPINFKKE